MVSAGAPSALSRLLNRLPAAQHAFAYGSGVILQPGLYDGSTQNTLMHHNGAPLPSPIPASSSPPSRPMVDFILAVPDPVAWHEQNIKLNPCHYSWVGRTGANTVVGIADYVGVGVHFNTLVPMDNQLVKYGVLSTTALLDDLASWRHLYIAGRMHKPVMTLVSDPAVEGAQAGNLWSALRTALLLLPHSFTTRDVLCLVVQLSYTGDVRMGFAEDPHKVSRIVAGSHAALEAMYLPLLRGGGAGVPMGGVQVHANGSCQQDVRPEARLQLLARLPPALLQKVGVRLGYSVPESHCSPGCGTAMDIAHAALQRGERVWQGLLRGALAHTVRASSVWQAASGLLVTGGGKAAAYVAAKLSKASAATDRGKER